MIKGVEVTLYERTPARKDELGVETFTEAPVVIHNVLVAPSGSGTDAENTNIDGKREMYVLAIPKSDDHIWKDRTVEFFGKKWRVVGFPQKGIDDLIPLYWNKKVQVEAYE